MKSKKLNEILRKYKNHLEATKTKKSSFDLNVSEPCEVNEIIKYNLQYRDTGNYEYNESILKFILEKEEIDLDLMSFLKTEIYNSQKWISQKDYELFKENMLNQGWSILTTEIIKKLAENKTKFFVYGRKTLQRAVYFQDEDNNCVGITNSRMTRKYLDLRNQDEKFYTLDKNLFLKSTD